MVICIPYGNGNKTSTGFWEDSTRLLEYYNGTYEYLKSLGIEENLTVDQKSRICRGTI